MSQGDWQLSQGDALTRFLFSEAKEARFAEFYTGEAGDPTIDYHFRNGSGPQEDAFCRRVFRQTHALRVVDPAQALPCHEVTFTGENDTVSFSDFRHLPFHLQRWLTVDLFAPYSGEFRFRIGTCGGVRLWIESELAACFTPFTRNAMQYVEVTLGLKAGKNSLLIHLDELFERDTIFALQMIYLSDTVLGVALPGKSGAIVDTLSQFARGLRPELAAYNHTVRLHSNVPAPEGIRLRAQIRGMGNDNFTPQTLDFGALNAKQSELTLPLPHDIGEAHYQLRLTLQCDDLALTRQMGINVMPDAPALTRANTLNGRKQEALRYIAENGMDRTSRLLAMMHLREYGPQCESLLNSTLKRISAREDCSDFSLVPLLWIWRYHQGEYFPAPLWRRVKSTLLGYRYWIDEPGCDVMWFWSENHALCFHTAQYLAGQFFPNERFIASGRSGREQQSIAEARLMQWFDAIEVHGFVEWNSAPYYPVDYIGLFALYQMADSQQIRTRAGQLIDRLMLQSALHYQSGVAAGTMGRVYEKELLAGMLTELSAYGAVAWGNGGYNRKCASLPLFCASDYVPPSVSTEYATMTEGELSAWYTCGGGNICVWKAPGVSLSSCVDHHTGEPGHQQHLVDLQFASRFDAKIWINHPGEAEPGGEKRPSFWAGNGVMPRVTQVENCALMLWHIEPENALPWTHIHLPIDAFEQLIATTHARIVRAGQAFAAVLCSAPLHTIEQGLTAGTECRAFGRDVAWYLEAGYGDDAAFADFCTAIAALELHVDAATQTATLRHPQRGEVRLTDFPPFPPLNGGEPRVVRKGVTA
ncbi:hypothetical protein [Lelliottia sp. CFBP8978]|uniref:hypothetical protein n=1 Tax=Lelliottia sp. CFBP8978 TaxID=3096522 RepID=UPI002A6A3352|nr:hypothetical protein [Lelliottia sp. CFBP8978]MDY1037155.1 hypothetical protein [Lelliottia sp. CFBP8978]